jgi:DNA-binding GntR family transcriptional regulator
MYTNVCIFLSGRNLKKDGNKMASAMPIRNFDSISGQIAKILAGRIIHGELKPGQRILEQAVSDEMGVSRSPVREAFLTLEKQRLVEILPRRGASVTEMSHETIQSLYDLAIELYALAARKAAEYHDEADLRRIRLAVQEIKQSAAEGHPAKYYEAIFDFANAALEAARNPLLTQTVEDLNGLIRRAQYATLSKRADDLTSNVAFFEQALDYAMKGDPERAAETIRAYGRNEKDFALRLLVKPDR